MCAMRHLDKYLTLSSGMTFGVASKTGLKGMFGLSGLTAVARILSSHETNRRFDIINENNGMRDFI